MERGCGWALPLYVDEMSDDFNQRYAVWPDRGRLVFDSGACEVWVHEPSAVEAWLRTRGCAAHPDGL